MFKPFKPRLNKLRTLRRRRPILRFPLPLKMMAGIAGIPHDYFLFLLLYMFSPFLVLGFFTCIKVNSLI